MTNKKKQIVFVIGMHRSGTSMITNILSIGGVYIGEDDKLLSNSNSGNIWGFNENLELMKNNYELFHTYEADWNDIDNIDPKNSKIISNDTLIKKNKGLLKKLLKKSSTIGFKDPKTSLLLPFWKEATKEYDVKWIYTIREPIEVAHSLKNRNDLEIEEGLSLWEKYNKACLSFAEDNDIFVADYKDFLDNTITETIRFYKYLGIEVTDNLLQKVDSNTFKFSRHFKENDFKYPISTKKVWDKITTLKKNNYKKYKSENYDYKKNYEFQYQILQEKLASLDKLVLHKESELKKASKIISYNEAQLKLFKSKWKQATDIIDEYESGFIGTLLRYYKGVKKRIKNKFNIK